MSIAFKSTDIRRLALEPVVEAGQYHALVDRFAVRRLALLRDPTPAGPSGRRLDDERAADLERASALVGIDNASAIFLAARHPKSFVSLDTADHLLSDRDDARYAGRVLAADVASRAGPKIAEIFAAHAGMLSDKFLREELLSKIEENHYTAEFAVARTAWEADVIVDLPVVKTHVRTGITCGLKNVKGVLPGDDPLDDHYLRHPDQILDGAVEAVLQSSTQTS